MDAARAIPAGRDATTSNFVRRVAPNHAATSTAPCRRGAATLSTKTAPITPSSRRNRSPRPHSTNRMQHGYSSFGRRNTGRPIQIRRNYPIPAFHHEAHAIRAPDGTVLIYMISYDGGDIPGVLSETCVGMPEACHLYNISHDVTAMAWSSSVYGPWKEKVILNPWPGMKDMRSWICQTNAPSATSAPNRSVIVAVRGVQCEQPPRYIRKVLGKRLLLLLLLTGQDRQRFDLKNRCLDGELPPTGRRQSQSNDFERRFLYMENETRLSHARSLSTDALSQNSRSVRLQRRRTGVDASSGLRLGGEYDVE